MLQLRVLIIFIAVMVISSCSPSELEIEEAIRQTQTSDASANTIIQTAIAGTQQAEPISTHTPTPLPTNSQKYPLSETLITTFQINDAIAASGNSTPDWEFEDTDLSSTMREIALLPEMVDAAGSSWVGKGDFGSVNVIIMLAQADSDYPKGAISRFHTGDCVIEKVYQDDSHVCGTTGETSSGGIGHDISGMIIQGPIIIQIGFIISVPPVIGVSIDMDPSWLDAVHNMLGIQQENLINAGY